MKKDKTDNIWKTLVMKFVSKNRRLYGLELLKVPEEIANKEKHAVQNIYNTMREMCLNDKEYLDNFEILDASTPSNDNQTNKTEPPTEDHGSLVPAGK